MGEWASYALADFLMFTPAIYFRQYELVNAALWPWHVMLLLTAAAAMALRFGVGRSTVDWTCLLLAPAWAVTAWWFLYRHYAPINLAAEPFAVLFALQALLLLVAGLRVGDRAPLTAAKALPGLLLFGYALIVHPLLAPLLGRSWASVEVFGMAPDPTALATLGIVLSMRSTSTIWLAVIPIAWCVFSGLTYLAMALPYGLLSPALAITVVALRVLPGRRAHGTSA